MEANRKAPQPWAITGSAAGRCLASTDVRDLAFGFDDFATLDAPGFVPTGSTVTGRAGTNQVGGIAFREWQS